MSAAKYGSSRQAFTVLIADDGLLERNMVKAIFQQQGHRVVLAADGMEALLAITSERPDVVVLDGVMPILDGYQVCRLVKDDPSTRHLPVILLTGQAEGLSRFWARICGADRFLLKGVDMVRLVDISLELLADLSSAPPLMDGEAGSARQGPETQAIHQRLCRGLEQRLLETAMRDTIGHLYTLQSDAADMAAAVLELLHELVLPGAIHLVLQCGQGQAGIGLYGDSVGPGERASIEEAAHLGSGLKGSWSSTWGERPPLKEGVAELHDPVLFSLPVGTPASPVHSCLTILMERRAFLEHERIFEVACHELNRILDLADSRRKLAQAEEALRQAQKMVSLGNLSAGVAHNINNVLAVIMGTASLRENLAADPLDREAYKTIGKASFRGRDVVNSLIQFGNPTVPDQTSFQLNGLMHGVGAALGNATGNCVKVTECFTEAPLCVRGDSESLSHALMNLCLNSLDAMPDGGTLTLRTAALERNWAEVSVKDTGSGMTPEVLAHALEPFYTTKEVGKGKGLGLSMAYGVVKAHGGTIDIASEPGQGTTVRLRFPRVHAPVQNETADSSGPSLRRLKVFLVDDDEDVRFLMTRMLKKAEVRQVRTFPGGRELLEDLHLGGRPDLIILDQNMPGMNGAQTMEQIRGLHPEMPILISSGQPNIKEWDCFKLPGVGVISKPFTVEEIQAKLAQFVHEPNPDPDGHRVS